MKYACPQCGAQFDRAQAASACGSCAQRSGCGRLKCPYCGHEDVPLPVLPSLFARLRRAVTRLTGGKHHG